jgi:WD domain, G-beta repeat
VADPFSDLTSSRSTNGSVRKGTSSSNKTMIIGIIVALHVIPIAVVLLFLTGVFKFSKVPPPESDSQPEIIVKHILPLSRPAEPPRLVPKSPDPPTVTNRPANTNQWDLPPVLPPAGLQPLIISGADPPLPAGGSPLPAQIAPLVRDFESKHIGPVYALAVLPNGKYLLSGGADKKIRAWDTATAKEVKVFIGSPQIVRALAVNGVGGAAASAGDDGAIRIWDLSNGREAFALTGHAGPARGVTFSPNGMYILSGGQDGTLRLWDLRTKEEVRNLKVGSPITCVAFCPDGRRALAGTENGLIAIYDLESAQPLHRTTGHINAAVNAIAFSRDGYEAVSVGEDTYLRLWDVASGTRMKIGSAAGPTGISCLQPARSVAYAGDGSWVIAAVADSGAAVVQTHSIGWIRVPLPPGKPLAMAVSPDGSTVYFGTDQGKVRRMDLQGGPDFIVTHAGQ